MGWTIQHLPGHTPWLSYTQVANLMRVVERELPARDFRALRALTVHRTDCWMELTPKQAGAIRDALNTAAKVLDRRPPVRGRREAREWAQLARDVATAADAAARSGRPWRWS